MTGGPHGVRRLRRQRPRRRRQLVVCGNGTALASPGSGPTALGVRRACRGGRQRSCCSGGRGQACGRVTPPLPWAHASRDPPGHQRGSTGRSSGIDSGPPFEDPHFGHPEPGRQVRTGRFLPRWLRGSPLGIRFQVGRATAPIRNIRIQVSRSGGRLTGSGVRLGAPEGSGPFLIDRPAAGSHTPGGPPGESSPMSDHKDLKSLPNPRLAAPRSRP